jgi:hypothetical protein
MKHSYLLGPSASYEDLSFVILTYQLIADKLYQLPKGDIGMLLEEVVGQLRDDLRVGVRLEGVPFALQKFSEVLEVGDYSWKILFFLGGLDSGKRHVQPIF